MKTELLETSCMNAVETIFENNKDKSYLLFIQKQRIIASKLKFLNNRTLKNRDLLLNEILSYYTLEKFVNNQINYYEYCSIES